MAAGTLRSVKRLPYFSEARLVEAKHRVMIIGAVMTSQAGSIVNLSESEVNVCLPDPKNKFGLGLNLLPQ